MQNDSNQKIRNEKKINQQEFIKDLSRNTVEKFFDHGEGEV